MSTDPVARIAISWWIRLQSGEDGTAASQACERWRADDPRHEAAWAHLVRWIDALRDIPSDFAHAHLMTGNAAGSDEATHV